MSLKTFQPAKPSTPSESEILPPRSPREEKLLRRLWRANRAIVVDWERNEKRKETDPETYRLIRRVLGCRLDHARNEVRRIEAILPDLKKPISAARVRGGVRKTSTKHVSP